MMKQISSSLIEARMTTWLVSWGMFGAGLQSVTGRLTSLLFAMLPGIYEILVRFKDCIRPVLTLCHITLFFHFGAVNEN